MMLLTAIPFYLFLPTFITWFMAYAISRTWDISWGNRPESQIEEQQEQHKATKDQENASLNLVQRERYFKMYSFALLSLIITSNILLCIGMVYLLDMNTVFGILIFFVSVALFQQVLSMFYYLFITDHLMTASLHAFSKKKLKFFGLGALVVDLCFLMVGVFTNTWLVRRPHIPTTISDALSHSPPSHDFYGLFFHTAITILERLTVYANLISVVVLGVAILMFPFSFQGLDKEFCGEDVGVYNSGTC
eukprot:Awhi_evm1s3955